MPNQLIRFAHTARMLAEKTHAEISIYGEVVAGEWWKWDDDERYASEFRKEINKLKSDGVTHLTIALNSPGGVVTEAVAMRAAIVQAGFESVDVRIDGLCASAATFFATIPGTHVSIVPGAEYMIHNPKGGRYGEARQLESYAKSLRNMEDDSARWYAAKSGQTEEQVRAWMDAETWFSASEAVANGFADELLAEESGEELPMVACVDTDTMMVMRSMYTKIPDCVREKDAAQKDSNVNPVAGETTVNKDQEEKHMDVTQITTPEQLQTENAELFNSIHQAAVNAERQRVADIDALTLSGYEDMAAKAKADGTSAVDFQKQIVAKQKAKAQKFMQQRQEEVKPAEKVTASEPADNEKAQEEKAFKDNADAIVAYAKAMRNDANGMY